MVEKLLQVKGSLVDSNEEVSIFEGFPVYFYEVKKQVFSQKEQFVVDALTSLLAGKKFEDIQPQTDKNFFSQEFFKSFSERVLNNFFLNISAQKILTLTEVNNLVEELKKIILIFFPGVTNPGLVANIAVDKSIGYGSLGVFLRDQNLEEIMVNGYQSAVFVFHRRFGMCKTNVLFEQKELDYLVTKISASGGKKFGDNYPFLDSRLLGGDRVNATFSTVTPFGSTLTVRKFTATPLSVVDLILNKTLSSEIAAFLWVMVEGLNVKPMNIIVTGGSGCGKTTTLNVLCSFVRHSDRIITIEDAVELDLGSRENWVRMESKPKLLDSPEVTMDDLLRNSLRMRPDRIVLGEVRGVEAQTLFVAMDTGHEGSMGTLHANNSREVILRLTSNPMNVPETMISLLDLIIVQARMYVKGKGLIRRILQVAEVSSMDKRALVGNLFEWDRVNDQLKRTDVPSRIIEELAEKTQSTKKEVLREIVVRKKILEFLASKKITSNPEVETIIQKYYYDPESVLEMIVKESGTD